MKAHPHAEASCGRNKGRLMTADLNPNLAADRQSQTQTLRADVVSGLLTLALRYRWSRFFLRKTREMQPSGKMGLSEADESNKPRESF